MRIPKQIQAGKFELSIIAASLFLILTLPIIILAYQHISVSALFEESAGFRYFYSLRILYSHERPWLPQGQLAGIIHIGIQYILTTLGYPITEVKPRIEIFSYIAASIPLTISAITYCWAASPLRTISARLLLACALIATTYAYSSRMFFPFWNTIPDYMNWFPVICLFSIGAAFRLLSSTSTHVWNGKNTVWLGIFLGSALAIKLTQGIFPFALICMMLFQDKRVLFPLFCVLQTLIIGVAVFLLINWIYYLGDINGVRDFFSQTVSFMRTSKIPISLKDWLLQLRPIGSADLTYLIILLPILTLVFSLFNAKARVLLSTLPAAFLYLVLLLKRFYWVTILEVQFFSFFLATIIIFLLARNSKRYISSYRVLLGFFLIIITWNALPIKSISGILNYYQQFNSAGNILTQLINNQNGVTALLGCDNNHRIPTVQTAICKGGINIKTYTWGDSLFVKSNFPKIGCYMSRSSLTHLKFSSLAFVRLPNENSQELFNTIQKSFHINLSDYNCEKEFPAPLPEALKTTLVFCKKL